MADSGTRLQQQKANRAAAKAGRSVAVRDRCLPAADAADSSSSDGDDDDDAAPPPPPRPWAPPKRRKVMHASDAAKVVAAAELASLEAAERKRQEDIEKLDELLADLIVRSCAAKLRIAHVVVFDGRASKMYRDGNGGVGFIDEAKKNAQLCLHVATKEQYDYVFKQAAEKGYTVTVVATAYKVVYDDNDDDDVAPVAAAENQHRFTIEW
jgi:uncharacterized glyoxalase superfamily protein PhnB